MSASNSFIMIVQGPRKEKSERMEEKGIKMEQKWFSVDGLSSEVRLN